MLVMPNVACLDPESAANITNYVRNGGTLFATMTTSFFDAAGGRLNRPSLADALGIGEVMSVHHYGNGCGYLDIEDPELLREDGVAPLTGGFGTALQCTYQAHAEILASMHVPMDGSYDAFPAGKFLVMISKCSSARPNPFYLFT